ncbi:exo-rhamnogalacturonan lyase family protein [Nonomuraea angiospora]|uniref:exo-rhamnogalacturonan lyase family protein n=1 Tax=Nonomuraea angiospora TaxID=46172 RepID=UPI001CEF1648
MCLFAVERDQAPGREPVEYAGVTGADWGNLNLKQAYARATAYAARQLSDVTLAERAWQELRTGRAHDPAYRLPGHRHVFQEDGAPIPNTSISCARVR